jgi:hypothetical protein
MSSRHDWDSWDQYQNTHERRLRDFDQFLIEDRLKAIPLPTKVRWEGELIFQHGLEIHVHKTQDKLAHEVGIPIVKTIAYSYQVFRRHGDRVVELRRYDNSDHHGYPDPHHRHRFNANGEEIGPPEYVGVDNWPTLGDVIQEVYDQWGTT